MKRWALRRTIGVATLTIGVLGCGGEDAIAPVVDVEVAPPSDEVEPAVTTLRTKLTDAPTTVTLDTMSGDSWFEVSIGHTLGGGLTARPRLGYAAGRMALSVTQNGALQVQQMQLDLPDVAIAPDDLPPIGVKLINMYLQLDRATLDTDWLDDDGEAAAQAQVDVVLYWSALKSDGEAGPLTPLRVRGAKLQAHLQQVDGAVNVALRIDAPGTFWSAGPLTFADATMRVVAATGDTVVYPAPRGPRAVPMTGDPLGPAVGL